MEIKSFTNSTIGLNQLLKVQNDSGKVRIPVKPAQSLYAHFKYIRGVPGNSDGQGVPISKLRILDTMIARLVQLKGGEVPLQRENGDDNDIDRLIAQYQDEFRTLTDRRNALTGFNFHDTGMLFNLFA